MLTNTVTETDRPADAAGGDFSVCVLHHMGVDHALCRQGRFPSSTSPVQQESVTDMTTGTPAPRPLPAARMGNQAARHPDPRRRRFRRVVHLHGHDQVW